MAGVINEEYISRVGQWPYTMQGILQFLGVFHGGEIKQKARCYVCAEKKDGSRSGLMQWDSNHERSGGDGDSAEEDSQCDVCESLQWNSEGKMVIYDQKDIGRYKEKGF